MEVAAITQSGNFKVVARRISMAFFSIVSLMGIIIKLSRNSCIIRSSSYCIFRLDKSSIRTITLERSRASFTLIPSEDRSYWWSSSLTTEHVSKAILVPFIANCPLIHYAVTTKYSLMFSKKPGNRFTIRVGNLFLKHL